MGKCSDDVKLRSVCYTVLICVSVFGGSEESREVTYVGL
jgi:hypothetical protein